MWLGGRKEGNGYQGNLMDGTGGDDGHSCTHRGERLRQNAGTPLETPDRKITVTQRRRAENEQLGKGIHVVRLRRGRERRLRNMKGSISPL